MDDNYPPDVEANCDNRSAQIIQIENGRAVLATTLCGVIAALGVGLSAFAIYISQQAAMEARVLEQSVMELKPRVDLLEKHNAD